MSDELENQQALFGSRVRMNSIEAFHLHSSSDSWPNCITSRHHFRGSIDIDLAKQAWLHCLSRQKRAAWQINLRGWPNWKVVDDQKQVEQRAESSFHEVIVDQWPDCETKFELPNVNDRGLPQVGVLDGSGFGMWCIRSASNDRFTLMVSGDHAFADGTGALTTVRDWMTTYHNLIHDQPINRGLVKLDWERWKKRSELGLFKWSFLKFLPCQAIGLFGATKFVLRRFSTIDAQNESRQTYRSPGIIGQSVDPEMVAELNDRAERLSVSTNSLLMTILFRTMNRIGNIVDDDNSPNSKWSDRKWIRLVLPISIRSISDRKLPCANRASLVQVERTAEQVADADAAAQSIDREVRIIMGFKLDYVFLIAIRMLSIVPALLKWVSRNQKSRGTVVFTNLGDPFRKTRTCNFRDVGNLKLVDYDFCGPIRHGTPINFAWSTSRPTINSESETHARVTLHFDRKVVSHVAAHSILQTFMKELQDVV